MNKKTKTKTEKTRRNRLTRRFLRAETLPNYELLTLLILAGNQSKQRGIENHKMTFQ